MKLREALIDKLPEDVRLEVNTSFDTIGDIAILEIDDELQEYQKVIAQTLLNLHTNIKVVVKKASEHEGTLRIQTYEHLAGEQRFETIAKENGIELFLDINKTYYSPRSQNERLRVLNQVQKGERVLVMFSGIAPFSIAIGKHTQASEVIGVELNEDACKYAQKNILRNKTSHVKQLQGDVREVVSKLGVFDRIIMPLPHSAAKYLDVARQVASDNTIIHLYCFSTEENIHSYAQSLLQEKEVVKEIVQAGSYNPALKRWCIDILVKKS